MDLVTHGLVGSLLAGLGIKQKLGYAGALVMVVANIAPDFDGILAVKGLKHFYKHHRELTHSIPGVLGMAGILAVLAHFLAGGGFGLYFLIALGGILVHLSFDLLTPWGLPLFYPFSKKKYSLDLIWFFDPVILTTIVLATLAAKFIDANPALISGLALVIITGYLALRISQKRLARQIIAPYCNGRYTGCCAQILPAAISPFFWDVIIKNKGRYLFLEVDTRTRAVVKRQEFASSGFHRVVRESKQSEYVQVFLKRSRYPFYTMTREANRYLVEWHDAHLLNFGGVQGIRVILDENYVICREKIIIKRPVRRTRRTRGTRLAVASIIRKARTSAFTGMFRNAVHLLTIKLQLLRGVLSGNREHFNKI